MAINLETLGKYAEKHVVLMAGDQTPKDVLQLIRERDYPGNDTWVVVSMPDEFHVIPLLELKEILREEGAGNRNRPLAALPIPVAGRVVPVDIPESTSDVLDWVNEEVGSTLIVTSEQDFAALITNWHMGIGDKLRVLAYPLGSLCNECQIELKPKTTPKGMYYCEDCDQLYKRTP